MNNHFVWDQKYHKYNVLNRKPMFSGPTAIVHDQGL